MSSEVVMGGREGGVERPILRIYQPKKKGARSAAKAHYSSIIEEKKTYCDEETFLFGTNTFTSVLKIFMFCLSNVVFLCNIC
jgi:hypothetical protein